MVISDGHAVVMSEVHNNEEHLHTHIPVCRETTAGPYFIRSVLLSCSSACITRRTLAHSQLGSNKANTSTYMQEEDVHT